MLKRCYKSRVPLFVLLVGIVAATWGFAGAAVIGSVAGTLNATVGGQALMPNTTLFSGDSLQVKDGVAVVAVGKTSRMVFGRETVASFLREKEEVTVLLGQGNVSLYHPDEAVALRVKAGEVSVVPAKGFKTLGEVAMLNGTVVVTAKEGMLRVEGRDGSVVNVAKGKTITVSPRVRQAAGGAAGASAARVSTGTVLSVATVGTSAASTVVSGVAMSRAGDAKTAATNATTSANSAATAATSAASAATAAQTTAVSAGCALNKLAASAGISPSPFTPPTGTSCK